MNLLFIDVETTGLNPTQHAIVQIAWVVASPNGVQTFGHARVVPHTLEGATDEAMAINGYDADAWAETAFEESKVAECIRYALERYEPRIAGHNVAFDVAFVNAMLERCGHEPIPARPQPLCTRVLAMTLLYGGAVESVSLAPLCEALGIEHVPHDPVSDVNASLEVWRHIMARMRPAEDERRAKLQGGIQEWVRLYGEQKRRADALETVVREVVGEIETWEQKWAHYLDGSSAGKKVCGWRERLEKALEVSS